MKTSALPHSITSFRDALGLAFELDDHYPSQTHSIHLSPNGDVEGVAKTHCGASPHEFELMFRPSAHWLLLTSTQVPIGPLIRSEIRWFSFLSFMAQIRSQTLLDWIVVDGDDARSFAYLLSPRTAWLKDPVETRQQDYLNMVTAG